MLYILYLYILLSLNYQGSTFVDPITPLKLGKIILDMLFGHSKGFFGHFTHFEHFRAVLEGKT